MLGLHAWLGLSASRNESTTVDEMAHLTAGHAMWTQRDFRLQPENGVLPQLCEGLPAVLARRKLPPPNDPGWAQPNVWTLGHVYFHELGNDLSALLLAGRAMNMIWSVATGLLVFVWTRRLFGLAGAFTALLFWAFSPTFLAHGALATSDMCMTFFMLASVGAYWRHLQNVNWKTALASAAITGLAFVAKYSAVLLPPMFLLLAAWRLLDRRPLAWAGRELSGRGRQIGVLLASAAIHVAAVVVIIWAFHCFRFLPTAGAGLTNDYTRPWAVVLRELTGPTSSALQWARSHHVLPDAYLYGFGFVVDLSALRGAFLNGARSLTGWVSFFPYAFLVKTPLALLAALALTAIVAVVRWRRTSAAQLREDLYRVAPLVALFVVYWGFSLASKLNIGHRHLLPTYPVVFIATGALGWAAVRWKRWWRCAPLLVLGQIAASAQIRPHYLAYFNAIAGGPSEGYRHLVDSSLDWGQELPGLAEWLRAHESTAETRVYLAYFGTGDPAYYGIHAIPMMPLLRNIPGRPWYRLEPGTYCVSATLLQQAYSPIRGEWTNRLETEYQKLHQLEPALLDYDSHPEHRAQWDAMAPASQWVALWTRDEQLRFTRLCYLLRARRPDAQIGFAINIYRLSASDIAAVTGSLQQLTAAVERASTSDP